MAVALPSATLIPSPAARAGSRENDNEGTGLPAGGTSPRHRARTERCPTDRGGAAGPARDHGRDRRGVARLEPARVGTTRRDRAQPTAASARDPDAAGARLSPGDRRRYVAPGHRPAYAVVTRSYYYRGR